MNPSRVDSNRNLDGHNKRIPLGISLSRLDSSHKLGSNNDRILPGHSLSSLLPPVSHSTNSPLVDIHPRQTRNSSHSTLDSTGRSSHALRLDRTAVKDRFLPDLHRQRNFLTQSQFTLQLVPRYPAPLQRCRAMAIDLEVKAQQMVVCQSSHRLRKAHILRNSHRTQERTAEAGMHKRTNERHRQWLLTVSAQRLQGCRILSKAVLCKALRLEAAVQIHVTHRWGQTREGLLQLDLRHSLHEPRHQ